MRGRTRLVVAATFAVGAVTSSLVGQASLRGRVTTPADVAIAGAEVMVANRSTLTDSSGAFTIHGLPAGVFLVQVRRVGFNPAVLAATFKPDEVKQVTIVLEHGTQFLPELNVTVREAKPVEYGWTSRYDEFFRRQRVGLGKFLSREDIERAHPARTPNLLAGTAGVSLRFYHLGPDGTGVFFSRCENVGVWIDGRRETAPQVDGYDKRSGRERGLGELLERIRPSQIEMMEIYRGPSEMPAEFLDDACAAIVIWTR